MSPIVLPWPPAELSSNARVHWAKRARATKKYRGDANMATLAARPVVPSDGDIALTVRFVPPHNRMDRGNYPGMAKAALDGVADALAVNDKRFRPHYEYAPAEAPGRVEILIGGKA